MEQWRPLKDATNIKKMFTVPGREASWSSSLHSWWMWNLFHRQFLSVHKRRLPTTAHHESWPKVACNCPQSRKQIWITVTIWIPDTRRPDTLGVRNSNGHMTWLTIQKTGHFGPKAFLVRFSDHHSHTGPFDNLTQVRYSDGYCIIQNSDLNTVGIRITD